MPIRISCVIPCKNKKDPKLLDLIKSIRAQDFNKEWVEVIVVDEGDSESAKAIGIRRARGTVIGLFCADNYVSDPNIFRLVFSLFQANEHLTGVYGKFYEYRKDDNSLNRYFSLMGHNDPVCWYLGKSDRRPYYEDNPIEGYTLLQFLGDTPSLGDNGFFVRRKHLEQSDLDHYYPPDNQYDIIKQGYNQYIRLNLPTVWHRTSDSLWSFMKKRYVYARDLYTDRSDRRWKMVDGAKDKWGLVRFAFSTVCGIGPVRVSLQGFSKIRDFAWFWHLPVCWAFLITYGALTTRCVIRDLQASLSRLWVGVRHFKIAWNPFGRKRTKTLKS